MTDAHGLVPFRFTQAEQGRSAVVGVTDGNHIDLAQCAFSGVIDCARIDPSREVAEAVSSTGFVCELQCPYFAYEDNQPTRVPE